ncbi:MAG: DUF4097 domain-containing protein [bacterium]|nr:DUF4097 domain-containing protein [bacterium]
MKQMKATTIVVLMILAVFFINLDAKDANKEKKVIKTFSAAETVKLKLISGDCIITKSSDKKIHVTVVYAFRENKYTPEFNETAGKLELSEKFEKLDGYVRGKSTWTLQVPATTNIKLETASGDFSVKGLKSKIDAELASGDTNIENFDGVLNIQAASGEVTVKSVSGKIKLEVASGTINLQDAVGAFKVECASGNIKAKSIVVKKSSQFTNASGNIHVVLAKSSEANIKLSTATGDITLDYNGNEIKGHFVFSGKKGNISSPIYFDDNDDDSYSPFVEKEFKKGNSPKIKMECINGNLKLKK